MKHHHGFMILNKTFISLLIYFFLSPTFSFAAVTDSSAHGSVGTTFLLFAIILFVAKMGGIVEKFKQPLVLGELIAGIFLSFLAYSGIQIISDIRTNEVIVFMAELGAMLLLFQIGLESNIAKISKVGGRAILVALTGVIVPFILGYFISPLIFPNADIISRLFIGASFVATSVGITSYVFKGFGVHKSRASQTVLGAAIIDDVLGLFVLSIIIALASGSSVDARYVLIISVKAFGFLFIAIFFGNFFAKALSKLFSLINTGTGMKLSLSIIFALLYSYVATLVGLAPIIGAFAAGLILDAVHFKSFKVSFATSKLFLIKNKHSNISGYIDEFIKESEHTHVERMVSSVGLIFVPIFFTFTGLQIDFGSFLNLNVYSSAIILAVVAIVGKVVSGIFASGNWKEKLLVGLAMVPRGEIGLIFITSGKVLGVISAEVFSTIVLVIVLTTFIAPPLIAHLLNGDKKNIKKMRL